MHLNLLCICELDKNYFRAETDEIMRFPPEIIYTELLCHNIIQTLVVLGNVIDVAIVADGLEVATGTFNFAFLRTSELRALEVTYLWTQPQNRRA